MDIIQTLAAAEAKIREAVALVAALNLNPRTTEGDALRGFAAEGEWLIEAFLDEARAAVREVV